MARHPQILCRRPSHAKRNRYSDARGLDCAPFVTRRLTVLGSMDDGGRLNVFFTLRATSTTLGAKSLGLRTLARHATAGRPCASSLHPT